MKTKNLSTPRKIFRGGLLALAMLSFAFFTAIVVFRVHPGTKDFLKDNIEYIFAADVVQHKALALTKDEDGKFKIATSLIQKGFFSPQYEQAGLDMLKELADKGHAPSQTVHANILLFIDTAGHKHQAEFYYTQAARQGYEPARDKLAELYPSF
jgi:TPR repeat protein